MKSIEYTTCAEIDCGMIAEITRRDVLQSTDGPVVHIGTICINRHILFMPEEPAEWDVDGTAEAA